ncbi:MAG: formylglycine-generating enzyme family protein [Chitinivibrionales bacterium]
MNRFYLLVCATAQFALLGCSSDNPNPLNQESAGSVSLSVTCGKVGSLSKVKTIDLQNLYVTLSAEDEADIRDTFAVSGYGRQTVTRDYNNLASGKTWTVSAESRDANDSIIHTGSKAVTVESGTSVPVTLTLSAQYSMLNVSFLPIMDSITQCEIVVDGETAADTTFAKQSLVGATLVLGYDYLTADIAPGIEHTVTLNAYGEIDGVTMLLYTGETTIDVVAGVDSLYAVTLAWVGPGQANASVTLQATAHLSMYGRFADSRTFNPAMVKIPAAGYFQMGEVGLDVAEPVHRVEFTYDFWMDTTEVTQEDYIAVMGVNPSQFIGDLKRPVETVTWYDAVLYCNARSKRDGLDTVYTFTAITGVPGNGCSGLSDFACDFSKNGYRLPTEAEWEFACRAGTTTPYFFDTLAIDSFTWYEGNSESTTHPVGEKRPNPFGLYDITGNVWEWCHDIYATYTTDTQVDPRGPAAGTHRVMRGGCSVDPSLVSLSAYRYCLPPYYKENVVGLRTVSICPKIPG